MSAEPLVVPLDDARCLDVRRAGGKGASLASMMRGGLPVPPGFVVTSHAFRRAVDHESLLRLLRDQNAEAAREVVARAEPPRELIEGQYRRRPLGAVAVRSSACAEDGADASYAGQQETYLFVTDLDEVTKRVTECWLSFFSERALFYRRHKGSLDDIGIAVVVQRMVGATRAGVLFTVDPVTGRRDRLVVEAAPGVGERVVSGEVTPDYYALDKRGTIKKKRLAGEQVMTEAELAELVALGLHLADLHGCPQDIEWAYDDSGLSVLQSRPITTV